MTREYNRRKLRRVLLASLLGASLLGALTSAGATSLDIRLQGRDLTATAQGRTVWSYSPAPELGGVRGPLRQGGVTYLGVGPAVLAFDDSGKVLSRYDLPAAVLTLDASGGVLQATTAGPDYRETFTLIPPASGGGTQERAVFAPDPAVTLWAAHAADLVPPNEVRRRWQQDGQNPFLGLRAAMQAQATGNAAQAHADLARLMNAPQPFPLWTALAGQLEAAGYPALATEALERARADAAQRGYDPAIRVSREAQAAYGNPLGYISTLLQQGRLTRAEVWLRHLRTLHPRVEGGEALFLRYAALLDSQGRRGEASEWRRFVGSLREGTLYHRGAGALEEVREVSRLLALSLCLSLVLALGAVLAASWRRARRSGTSGMQRGPLLHASLGERLVLLGLGLGLTLCLSGALWAARTASLLAAPALNTGTYGGAWAEEGLSRLPAAAAGADAALIRGLARQLDGDLSAARVSYQAAGPLPCARNNLGTVAQLRGDRPSAEALYRAALEAQPDLGAAAYNLGFPVLSLGSEFQVLYRGAEPRLCYPDDRSLIRALGGDIRSVWRAEVVQPVPLLRQAWAEAEAGRLSPWLTLALAQALTLALLVLALLPTREATEPAEDEPESTQGGAQAAARPGLLAWLLPGTGLLSGVWGGVLLLGAVTAALLLAAALGGLPAGLAGGFSPRPLPAALVLGASYLINSAALAWRRR